MEEDRPLNLTDEEVRSIKTQYNKAKNILENVISLQSKIESAELFIGTKREEIDKHSISAKEFLGTIDNAKTLSANLVSEIKSNLEKVQNGILQIDEGTKKYAEIQGKIQGQESAIDTLVAAANGLKDDVEQAKLTAIKRLAEVENQLVQIAEKIAQMQTAFTAFQGIQAKIIDPQTGLEAILGQTRDIQKSSSKLVSEISTYRDQSKKFLDEIEGSRDAADVLVANIEESRKTADEKKDQVAKIAELITNTGFANSFQQRQKKLEVNSRIWLSILGISILLLVGLLVAFFLRITGVPEVGVIFYRLTLTSPLVFLIFFAATQYSNERSLEEKYAFKATIAVVMRNHADFLIEKGRLADAETNKFIRDTMTNLYVEPYENGDAFRKEKERADEEEHESKRLELEALVNSAKELKQLFKDESLLKSVIDFFQKLRK